MKQVKKVDITVIQSPVAVEFECPHCEEDINIDFVEFEGMAGEPCDWCYTKIECPKCEKKIQIDNVEW